MVIHLNRFVAPLRLSVEPYHRPVILITNLSIISKKKHSEMQMDESQLIFLQHKFQIACFLLSLLPWDDFFFLSLGRTFSLSIAVTHTLGSLEHDLFSSFWASESYCEEVWRDLSSCKHPRKSFCTPTISSPMVLLDNILLMKNDGDSDQLCYCAISNRRGDKILKNYEHLIKKWTYFFLAVVLESTLEFLFFYTVNMYFW